MKQIIIALLAVFFHFKGDLMKYPVALTCGALWLASVSSLAWAADVPPGTVLAEKQLLVRHIKDEPASLDPAKAVGLPEIRVIRDLFEGLVNQDAKGNLVPCVATRWQSNDNRVWTFTLRDNARWSDGTPVTAEDFVYSWQRLVDPKPLRRSPGSRRWRGSLTRRTLLTAKPRRRPWESPPSTPTPCGCSWINHCRGLAT